MERDAAVARGGTDIVEIQCDEGEEQSLLCRSLTSLVDALCALERVAASFAEYDARNLCVECAKPAYSWLPALGDLA